MQSITLFRATIAIYFLVSNNFLTASYASQLQTRRDALAQENQSIVLKGIPMKLGKRGQKFLEYQKTFCWNRREQDLLRIISFEAQVYYQERLSDRRNCSPCIPAPELHSILQARLRDKGLQYHLSLPSCLIFKIGGTRAPEVILLFKRLRTLHPSTPKPILLKRAVQLRLQGCTCVVH